MNMTDETPHGRASSHVGERRLDAGALRALAHPLRVQIYDILSQYGPQTASSLAAMTGESTGSTSYHLRALAKHALIREVPDRGTGRERWWERVKGAVRLGAPEALRTPAGRAASQVVTTEFLTRRHRQLLDYTARSMQSTSPDDPEGMVVNLTLQLTTAQMKELSDRIDAVLDEYVQAYGDQSGAHTRPVAIDVDVFPLPHQKGSGHDR